MKRYNYAKCRRIFCGNSYVTFISITFGSSFRLVKEENNWFANQLTKLPKVEFYERFITLKSRYPGANYYEKKKILHLIE